MANTRAGGSTFDGWTAFLAADIGNFTGTGRTRAEAMREAVFLALQAVPFEGSTDDEARSTEALARALGSALRKPNHRRT